MDTKLYVIEGTTYEKHIDEEVHLYGLLHQLSFLAGKVKDAGDMANLIETAQRYGEIADEKFDMWDIPGRYLVYGDKADLADLKEKELAEVEVFQVELDQEDDEPEDCGDTSAEDRYIISGSSFRLLVGDIFKMLAQYGSLIRRITEAKTEKDLERLQKSVPGVERMFRRMFHRWGIQEGGVTACDMLEQALMKTHLTPMGTAHE